MTAPLFPSLLGADFERLPAQVRLVHGGQSIILKGQGSIVRGQGWLSRCAAFVTRLPPAAGMIDVSVEITAQDANEHWRRTFGSAKMPSRLSLGQDGLLIEQLGAVQFHFELLAHETGFHWRVRRVKALGIPLPAAWFSDVHANSFAENGQYRFDVQASLPLSGLLVHYQGWLAASAS
jgi:Domain of unknown function (DUF4166)